jgi:uncharacterized protein
MPRQFFRKFGRKRHELSGKWFMTPFRHLLQDHRLWGIRHKTVVPAFALGLFIAFLPFPGHFMVAALCALAFKINVPVASLTTLVVNPLTMFPLFYFAYRIGAALLSVEPGQFDFEFSFAWLTHNIVTKWPPLMLGGALVGAIAALCGYVILDVLWRYSLADYKSKKRSKKR